MDSKTNKPPSTNPSSLPMWTTINRFPLLTADFIPVLKPDKNACLGVFLRSYHTKLLRLCGLHLTKFIQIKNFFVLLNSLTSFKYFLRQIVISSLSTIKLFRLLPSNLKPIDRRSLCKLDWLMLSKSGSSFTAERILFKVEKKKKRTIFKEEEIMDF